MAEQDVEIALLRADVDKLNNEIVSLRADVADLAQAWRTASGVVAFAKWIAGAVTAIGLAWATIKVRFFE